MRVNQTQPDRRASHSTGMSQRFHRFVAMAAICGCVCALSVSGNLMAQDQARMGADIALNNGLPPEAQGVTVDQNLGKTIRLDLPITDSNGRAIKTGYVFDGKLPTIVTLNYSNCPMLCSIQLNKLTSALGKLDLKLGTDFRILTLSIDPTETTQRIAETKARYLDDLNNQPEAESGWVFCTAKQPIITQIADTLGFRYKYDRVNKQYNHPAMLAFVSPTGVITRYSLDIDFPADQIKLALVEAGEGTVGSPVDQFILWCYSYDPQSNSYTPAAWKIMRICGAGFLVIMLICLVPYWVGRKRTAADETETVPTPDPV
ncbi:SCO family protein [Stieleria varia]|nr:SCO family protein [Stieleria varia]